VAITGSNGKTTVKEMTASIFAVEGRVHATQGNLNNDIGLPLTLLGLDRDHDAAVVELGANHPGEIAYLTAIAQPDAGVVTNAGAAHLEGFGSVAGVARAKGELFAGLPPQGIAVINADDAYASLWEALAGERPRLRFALAGPGEVTARWEPRPTGGHLDLRLGTAAIQVALPLPGRHNAANALAAAALATAVGVSPTAIRAGLESIAAVPGRLARLPGIHGAQVLDDSYNANPGSLGAGLAVLGDMPGRRWVVLGDMAELGEGRLARHREAGLAIRAAGVERLYGVGEASRAAVEAFGDGGLHFATLAELNDALAGAMGEGIVVLIKGSRSMRMERVLQAVVAAPQDEGAGRG
jgi:UDP-N-acetylmuramoyl-tripeptide--D-alanyl-D-alanine ligase